MEKTFAQLAEFYQNRFGFLAPKIREPLQQKTRVIITIPCHNEPNLLGVLQSLKNCQPPLSPIEVIVGINAGMNASEEIHQQNLQTKREFEDWVAENETEWLQFHHIYTDNLPKKHAGAGLARKIIMDEAFYRFSATEKDGLIVCLDADCEVAPNYLVCLENAEKQNPKSQAFALNFSHNYREEKNELLQDGIIQYELHLRYYIRGLRYANFPYSLHTIGSSMAVRAKTYAKVGGMNRRKAGEDFYFMHKIMPQGQFSEINETCVFPSCRVSDRVPFGTGRAQKEWLREGKAELESYQPVVFEDLKCFFSQVDNLYDDGVQEELPDSISKYLETIGFVVELNRIRQQSANIQQFRKHFFSWFDGFKVLKFIHFARDNFYKNSQIASVAQQLLGKIGMQVNESNPSELLSIFRKLDSD